MKLRLTLGDVTIDDGETVTVIHKGAEVRYCPMEEANALLPRIDNATDFGEVEVLMDCADNYLDEVMECHKCGYYGGICKDFKTSFYENDDYYEEY